MSPWDDISRAVAATTGSPFNIDQRATVGGGGINSAYRIEGGGAGYFVKLNAAEKAEMFAAEAAGLLEIAHSNTLQKNGARLLDKIPAFFSGNRPQPALLHGDLWSGNVGFDEASGPVIFDPAVYYGDREADVAMTELFGGFSNDFYAAYRDGYPLDTGYAVRKHLYNLYHVLNHLNLFGGSYLGQDECLISELLAEV